MKCEYLDRNRETGRGVYLLHCLGTALISFLLANAPPAFASRSSLDKDVSQIVDNLAPHLSVSDKIAVLNIKNLDGKANYFGTYLSNLIATELANRSFIVLERNNIDIVFGEQKFQVSGAVISSEAVKIGALAGANVVTVGSIADLDTSYDVNIRLIRIQSGLSKGGTTFQIRKTRAIQTLVETITESEKDTLEALNAETRPSPVYAERKSAPNDPAEVVKWYRKAAEQGDSFAQVRLGLAYYVGIGVPKNIGEALKWWGKAAEQGNSNAQYHMGAAYISGEGIPQDFDEAVKWFRKAAEQGNARAQSDLGVAYAKGEGIPQDFDEAVKWFHKAAEQGNAIAQYNLGIVYARGKGVPKDPDEAVKWFRKAAEQGNTMAQYHLGVVYDKGEGVPEDDSKAYFWSLLAATHGDPAKVKLRNAIARKLDSDGRAQVQDEAARWKPSPASD